MIKAGDRVVIEVTEPISRSVMEIIDEVQTVCAIVGEEDSEYPFCLWPSKVWCNKEGVLAHEGQLRTINTWEAENKY